MAATLTTLGTKGAFPTPINFISLSTNGTFDEPVSISTSLLSITEARLFIETDLTDSALQTLINNIETEITSIVGDLVLCEENFYEAQQFILVNRPILSISSILEKRGSSYITLSSTDYEIVGQRLIKRSHLGTYPYSEFSRHTIVSYVPKGDHRKQVMIDVLKMTIEFNGLESERIGDYSKAQQNYLEKRRAMINSLRRFTIA